ncbi:uncharacterized protein FOMMEDRAFT_164361 [Fomitiporia mediterranea MF3/22]|uniref:uncharacterized protein n=1 Tax=Fomitiporia mediterranea (strain MF3/22) TaxID=694068 RepID=UPI0004409B75|nr:uncharacterized protein FOMMEDRAFT_164361 [Fomitiporia mediterranea MF3/22]EJD07378.1 hypothetical protein FOMMEDRAFT_164361 [Fomitiporia mediterranea MF3/22]
MRRRPRRRTSPGASQPEFLRRSCSNDDPGLYLHDYFAPTIQSLLRHSENGHTSSLQRTVFPRPKAKTLLWLGDMTTHLEDLLRDSLDVTDVDLRGYFAQFAEKLEQIHYLPSPRPPSWAYAILLSRFSPILPNSRHFAIRESSESLQVPKSPLDGFSAETSHDLHSEDTICGEGRPVFAHKPCEGGPQGGLVVGTLVWPRRVVCLLNLDLNLQKGKKEGTLAAAVPSEITFILQATEGLGVILLCLFVFALPGAAPYRVGESVASRRSSLQRRVYIPHMAAADVSCEPSGAFCLYVGLRLRPLSHFAPHPMNFFVIAFFTLYHSMLIDWAAVPLGNAEIRAFCVTEIDTARCQRTLTSYFNLLSSALLVDLLALD